MLTRAELDDAIHVLSDSKHSIQNCERLAAVYTVRDHMYPQQPNIERGYSTKNDSEKVGLYGASDFLMRISQIDTADAWMLMDELMETIKTINPRLYEGVMQKI